MKWIVKPATGISLNLWDKHLAVEYCDCTDCSCDYYGCNDEGCPGLA